jgi:hypothetical protein
MKAIHGRVFAVYAEFGFGGNKKKTAGENISPVSVKDEGAGGFPDKEKYVIKRLFLGTAVKIRSVVKAIAVYAFEVFAHIYPAL